MHQLGQRIALRREHRAIATHVIVDATTHDTSNIGMKCILATPLLLTLATPSLGQDLDRGHQAYEQWDCATELRGRGSEACVNFMGGLPMRPAHLVRLNSEAIDRIRKSQIALSATRKTARCRLGLTFPPRGRSALWPRRTYCRGRAPHYGRLYSKHISTPYLGRQTLSMRTDSHRMTPIANALATKAENHVHVMSICITHHNFNHIYLTMSVGFAMSVDAKPTLWEMFSMVKALEDWKNAS